MKSYVTRSFRQHFSRLPTDTQKEAREAYKLFKADPYHPSLQFKQVHPREPIVSVRIGLGYRAPANRRGDTIYWFWIGSHADYDRIVSRR